MSYNADLGDLGRSEEQKKKTLLHFQAPVADSFSNAGLEEAQRPYAL